MSAAEMCSKLAPCRLCAFKISQSPPSPKLSPHTRGNKPRPQPLKLKPIITDKNDIVAVKRANNTMAARKSRQKQIDYLESLEKEGEELRAERNHWKNWAKFIEERYAIPDFPKWMPFSAVPVEASPIQSPPREVIAMQQAASTQHVPVRTLPLDTT